MLINVFVETVILFFQNSGVYLKHFSNNVSIFILSYGKCNASFQIFFFFGNVSSLGIVYLFSIYLFCQLISLLACDFGVKYDQNIFTTSFLRSCTLTPFIYLWTPFPYPSRLSFHSLTVTLLFHPVFYFRVTVIISPVLTGWLSSPHDFGNHLSTLQWRKRSPS